MKPRCQVYVPARRYGEPGQCAARRGLARTKIADTTIIACSTHRAMIGSGRRPSLTGLGR